MFRASLRFTFLAVLLGGLLPPPCQGATARIMRARYPVGDVPIAAIDATEAPYHADPGGRTDATPAIGRALDDIAARGGGVVWLPAGQYRLDGSLVVPEAVTLRGDWKPPTEGDRTVGGTILLARYGRGIDAADAAPLLGLSSGSGLRNLSIFHPEQTADDIRPYPPAIGLAGPGTVPNSSRRKLTVMDVTLVNPYRGIFFGPQTTMHANVRRVYGSPLAAGVQLSRAVGFPRFQQVHFSPRFWVESGLPAAPTASEVTAALRKRDAVGFLVQQSDNGHMIDIQLADYPTGIRFLAHPEGQGSNGKIYNLTVRRAHVGLDIQHTKPHSWSVSASRIEAGDDPDAVAVRVAGELRRRGFQFNKTEFSGKGDLVRQAGANLISAVNCTFLQKGRRGSEEPAYAVDADRGAVILLGNTFRRACTADAPHVRLGPEVDAQILGNTFPGPPVIEHHAGSDRVVIDHRLGDFAAFDLKRYEFAPRPKPARTGLESLNVVTAAPFHAAGDGQTDDTGALQAALDAAGAAGGGTVYLPAAMYRLDGHLRVPAGVELRGVHDVPTYTFVAGSVLLARPRGDRGNAAGTPLVRLESDPVRGGAGLRGLVFWYPEQNHADIQSYPWTVQSQGPGCWLVNVLLANAYRGADFGTHRNDGHVIDWLSAAVLDTALFVGNSASPGWVENVQCNPQFWSSAQAEQTVFRPLHDLPGYKPHPGDIRLGGPHSIFGGTGIRLGYSTRQSIMGSFFHGPADGIHLVEQPGLGGPNAVLLNHGGEALESQIRVSGTGNSGVDVINLSSHNLARGQEGSLHAVMESAAGDEAVVRFFNTISFGGGPTQYEVHGGTVLFQQMYFMAQPDVGFDLTGGRTALEGIYFRGPEIGTPVRHRNGEVAERGNIVPPYSHLRRFPLVPLQRPAP